MTLTGSARKKFGTILVIVCLGLLMLNWLVFMFKLKGIGGIILGIFLMPGAFVLPLVVYLTTGTFTLLGTVVWLIYIIGAGLGWLLSDEE